jgi:hypothetical protein
MLAVSVVQGINLVGHTLVVFELQMAHHPVLSLIRVTVLVVRVVTTATFPADVFFATLDHVPSDQSAIHRVANVLVHPPTLMRLDTGLVELGHEFSGQGVGDAYFSGRSVLMRLLLRQCL